MLEKIMNDQEIVAIINNVNNIIIINNCGCHGMGHVKRVMDYVKIILTGINCDTHTIELGMIAAYLHDIGAIMGKDNHAKRSAEFVDHYLTKINMNEVDKNKIVMAIKNHSQGSDTIIGAALTLSDKIDMNKNRMLRFIDGNYFHDNVKHILDVQLKINNENIIINIITDGMFDYKSLKSYSKMIDKPVEMAKYLNRNCIFQIDNKEIDLYNIINS